MGIRKIVGLALIAVGVVLLVYRGFTYTKETHKGGIGPLQFNVKEKEHVSVPVWVGVVTVVAGAGVLVLDRRSR